MVLTVGHEVVQTSKGPGFQVEVEEVDGQPLRLMSYTAPYQMLSAADPYPMFTVHRYAELASEYAVVEQLEDGRFFAEAEDFPGVWGDGDTESAARDDFRAAVASWVIARIDNRLGNIPILDAINLNVL